MSRIAADGRTGWRNGIPCIDTVRSFRARHRDITCRRSESKEHAKLSAENFEHVESFFSALQSVSELRPGILSNPNLVWNMDETSLDAVEGNQAKVMSGADSNHGGFRAVSSTYGISKHVTAVLAVSASGLKAPPFFIVAGKKISCRWLEPVRGSFRGTVSGICSRFMHENWFPDDGVIKVTENGSMEISVMSAFVNHVNDFVRKVTPSETYLLCLDGHSSRKGIEWIEDCMQNNCEAVVSPANTSHFLQACDQTVNKRFKAAMRELRDAFCMHGTVDTRKINFNLACGVYAFEQITAEAITNSFRVTGVYPFDRRFPLQFKTDKEKSKESAMETLNKVAEAGPAFSLKAVMIRQSDRETLQEAERILRMSLEPCRIIQQLSILLKNSETTNSILMSAGGGTSRGATTEQSTNVTKVSLIDPGAPAEWVTVRELLERKRRKEEEEARCRIEKDAERARKELERAERAVMEQQKREQKKTEREKRKAEKQGARQVEKRRKLEQAAAKELQSHVKQIKAKRAKAEAKKMKEVTVGLARASALFWKEKAGNGARRKQNKTAYGKRKAMPYQRSFQYAATLVMNVFGDATSQADVDNRFQN